MVYESQPLLDALEEWKKNFSWIPIHYPVKTMPE
jgi:hypothetical protein